MLKSMGSRSFFVLFVAVALGAAAHAAAPNVGPQIRVDNNGGTSAASETSGVVTDVNEDEIIGTWNDWRDSGGSEVIRMGVSLSMDGGQTWDDFLVRAPGPNQGGVEGDPMTAVDPRTGAMWVGAISWTGNGGMFVARKDAGDDFFQPSVLADGGSGLDKCWMVAGRDNVSADSTRVYITYNFGSIKSDDMGDSWTNPVSLGSGIGFLPRIGPNGEYYVTYWNYTNETFQIKRSLDGGDSFSTHTIVSRMDNWGAETFNSRFAGTFRVAPLPGLAVHPDNGTLYTVWPDTADYPGGEANVDVFFSRSYDQGTTWETPVVLNDEGPFIGDQFFPWIEIDPSGRLHVVYLDSRHTDQQDNVTHGMFDAYYAYSEDDGDSWTEIRLTPQSWDSDDDGLDRPSQFIGDYLGMGVTEFTAWPFYTDTTNGDLDVYTNKIEYECLTPEEVSGLTVSLTEDGSSLVFNWAAAAEADGYILYQDVSPDGEFLGFAGAAFGGGQEATIPVPSDTRYYLVAGKNGCGFGPK